MDLKFKKNIAMYKINFCSEFLKSWQNSDQRHKDNKDKDKWQQNELYRVEIAVILLFVNFSCRNFVRADDIEMFEEFQIEKEFQSYLDFPDFWTRDPTRADWIK